MNEVNGFLGGKALTTNKEQESQNHAKQSKNRQKHNQNIKIIPLGGVGEIAKNMYIVEVDDEMFMFDAGLMFPEDEMLGIDAVIPDISYVIQNKHKLKGIFLSHGHDDSIGAIPYIMDKVNAPIYASKLTLALVKDALIEHKVERKVKFFTINEDSVMKFDHVHMTFFNTTHSIPDAYGVALHTQYGAIVYTGEFKMDQTMQGKYSMNIIKMSEVASNGVFALISDSTSAEKQGFNTPESEIGSHILDEFSKSKARIIVSCYASNFIRIQQVLDAAASTNRKVSFLGKSLESSFSIARKLGYFNIADDLLIPIHKVEDYPDNEVVVIATGSEGEPIENLQRMAKGQHNILNLKPKDNVFITTTPSSNMEVVLYQTMNDIVKAGANIISNAAKVHASSHGTSEELRFVINLMKPKYFIPVQGEFKMQIAHAKIASETGVVPENIYLLEKGDVLSYDSEQMTVLKKVEASNVLIDGRGVGDVGNIVLRDRRILSEDGIFIIVVTIDKNKKEIVAGPKIQSRGFVYVRKSEELLQEADEAVIEIVKDKLSENRLDWSEMKSDIRDRLGKMMYDETKRRPMIIPIIQEVKS